MAAADYKICCALFDAYIAKISKKNPEMMLQDRRSISQGEILTLIDWFANHKIKNNGDCLTFNSGCKKGFRVKVSFEKIEDS